jgi:hypothetical protein
MTTQRIYAVTGVINDSATTRLVRAPNAAQALRHVAADTFDVEVPSQDRLFALASAGVKVEECNTNAATSAKGEDE